MRYEKRHAEIANKYCHTVSFYRNPDDPYSVEEMKADKQQAADKRKLILAYLQTLESISYRFQDDIRDAEKRKLLAVELAGARGALFYLWKVYHPETSAWNSMFLELDRAGSDLYPEEYAKIFPHKSW